MAKLKPARPRKSKSVPVQGGLPCVVLVIVGIVLVLILLFLVLKYGSV